MINHLSYALSEVPEVIEYLKGVDRRINKHDTASFFGAVEGFESIIQPHLWDAIYASALSLAVDDPRFNGGKDWNTYGLLLCETDSFHFSMRAPKRDEVGRHVLSAVGDRVDAIASVLPSPSVLFAISDHPVLFDVFELDEKCDLNVFDSNAVVSAVGRRKFPPWTRIDVDAPRETMIMCPASTGSCCVVELGMKPVFFQRWEFDRVTGSPVGAVLLSRESAILIAMLAEIRRSMYQPALSAVMDLVEHPDFNVRWACAKCVCAMDGAAGRAVLKRLTSDSNVVVKAQAMRMLSLLEVECDG